MALPAAPQALDGSKTPPSLQAAGGALGVALVILAAATARLFPVDVAQLGAGAAVLLALVAAVLAAGAGQGGARASAIKDGLLGTCALVAASAAQLLYAPSWPAGMVVALAVGVGLSVRSGALSARAVALGAGVVELLHMLGPRVDLPSVVGLACAQASMPLLVEAFARRWREGLEQWARDQVDARLRGLDEDARAYRLIATTTDQELSPQVREHRRTVGSVHAIKENTYALMDLASRLLDPHTVALFMLDASGKELRLQELISRSDFVVSGALPADKGVLGTVLKKRAPMALSGLTPEFAGITYYHPPVPPAALLAVPVMDGEHLRGVLLCDWIVDRELRDRDTAVVTALAREIMRAVENERLFARIDREKSHVDALHRVSQEFIKALTVQDTFKVTLATARRVADADVAMVVMKDGTGLQLEAVDGLPPEVAGKRVPDADGQLLAIMSGASALPNAALDVARLRAALGTDVALEGVNAVKVFPIREKAEAEGLLIIGSTRRAQFAVSVEDRLQLVADMAALAVANARLYQRMERMATTDGLTGLLNHRTFQERMSDALLRSKRYNRPLAMILTDIDHFKSVNDTYGHPVGDKVIQRVSAVMAAQTRGTDVVARYGGEEFAIVMEETDAEGALLIAERIRQQVQKEIVTTDLGPLKVTISLGVAAFPSHGNEKHVLIEKADQALYSAKHGGRNRAVIGAPAVAPPAISITPQPEKA